MKKLRFLVVSIFALLVSAIFSACTFKTQKATFVQHEELVSIEEAIDLNDYVEVENILKSDIVYKMANPRIAQIEGSVLTGLSAGSSFVYATKGNNTLASMNIVVKDKFAAPTNISINSTGLISWDAVSAVYGNSSEPTIAREYTISGTLKTYSPETGALISTDAINTTVKNGQTSYQLTTHGVYDLVINAVGMGYFDSSDSTTAKTFTFGYMPLESFATTWDSATGNLSWTGIAGAKYKVKVGNAQIGDFIITTNCDLTTYFDAADAGRYNVSVVVYDEDGQLLPAESNAIVVEKLEEASVVYDHAAGGQIVIEVHDKAAAYEVVLTNTTTHQETKATYTNEGEAIVLDHSSLVAGLYDLTVVATNTTSSTENYYKSDVNEFGRLYKLGSVSVSGKGGNQENGNKFAITVTREEGAIKTDLVVSGLEGVNEISGFEIDELGTEVSDLTLDEVKIYNLKFAQVATDSANMVNGREVYVLKSNDSAVLTASKVGAIAGEVEHSVSSDKSVLTFAKATNATAYEVLRFDGENFVSVSQDYAINVASETEVVVTFSDLIDNLYEAVDGKYTFKAVAKTADDRLAINASLQKEIVVLAVPTSASSGNTASTTYEWTPVQLEDEADRASISYEIEIYSITKALYEANRTEINIDTTSLPKQTRTATQPRCQVNGEGYYYVRVFAKTSNKNDFVESKEYLEEVFYVFETLEAGEVLFAYDDQYKNYTGFSGASGFYLEIAEADNVDAYTISINGEEVGFHKMVIGEQNIYLLAEEFADSAAPYEIAVVAKSNDDTIYKDSAASTMSIVRLASITYDDMTFDDQALSLEVLPQEGTSRLSITASGSPNTAHSTDPAIAAKFIMSALSNSEFTFVVKGSAKAGAIYTPTNNTVYLDAQTATFTISRVEKPTQFRYQSGKLLVDHTEIAETGFYVLDITGKTQLGSESQVRVKLAENSIAVMNGQEVVLGTKDEFVTIDDANETVSIDLEKIVELIKASDFAGVYNQAVEVKFAVFAYQNNADGNVVHVSSHYATKQGSTETELTVEKMGKPTLTFEDTATDYVLKWTEVVVGTAHTADTTYQVFCNGVEYGQPISGVLTATYSHADFEEGVMYEFYVQALNPAYLESNQSNVVRIYKLKAINKLNLLDDGTLGYEIASTDVDFVEHVAVSVGGASATENTTGAIAVTAEGEYVLQVVGMTVDADDQKTYYISSEKTKWTVLKMENEKPADETVTFENNVLSWNAFAYDKTLTTLEYVVIFKDKDGNSAIYKTTETSHNIDENEELRNTIASLVAGTIEIEVSAHLKPYSVAVEGTMYYAAAETLLNGAEEYNYYIYQSEASTKKLTTPEVVDVEFEEGKLPEIEVVFEGNYGASGEFDISLNNEFLKTVTLTEDAGQYKVVITSDEYNNVCMPGETMKVSISARSSNGIPSSVGEVSITRTGELVSARLLDNEGVYSQRIEVVLNEEYLPYSVGGVVAEITYTPNGGTETTEEVTIPVDGSSTTIVYDLSTFITTYLSAGGSMSIALYATSYSGDGVYYLACPTTIAAAGTYQVLKAIQDAEISRYSGGFIINNPNNDDTVYEVSYQEQVAVLTRDNSFAYEFPRNFGNESYTLTIVAKENGYVVSSQTQHSFTLNRLGSISEVKFSRDTTDLSKTKMSWISVSGATGYEIRLFAKDDAEKEVVLFVGQVTGTEVTMEQLFGLDYEKLFELGQVSAVNLQEDFEAIAEIVAVGDASKNNAIPYEFDITIKGNSITEENLVLDERAFLTMDTEVGQSYLYRFVKRGDNSVLQTWKMITATAEKTVLDTSTLAEGVIFNTEVIRIGSAISTDASSNDLNGFVLDSMLFNSGLGEMTFQVNEAIKSIGYVPEQADSIALTLGVGTWSKIFAGTSKDALKDGKYVEFVPEYFQDADQSNQIIAVYNFADFIDLFDAAGIEVKTQSGITEIFFWSFRDTEEETLSYVVSKCISYKIKYVDDTSFVEIKKFGAVDPATGLTEDYANTYAMFNDIDAGLTLVTAGMFVKVTEVETGNYWTNFVSVTDMRNCEYVSASSRLLAVNITKVFESEALNTLYGTFKVEFARAQLESASGTTYIQFTDWVGEHNGQEFIFERMNPIAMLQLKAGSLSWKTSSMLTDKYYVYFYEVVDEGKMGDKFAYYSTNYTYFNASDFAGTNTEYFLAVQSISTDPFILSSAKEFIKRDDAPVAITKNHVATPLVLKNGQLSMSWTTDSDLYQLVTSEMNYSEIAGELSTKIFTAPFTFSLEDLLANNIVMRFRFTPKGGVEGARQIFDVNAKYLIASLYDFAKTNGFANIEERMKEIQEAGLLGSQLTLLGEFSHYLANGSYGIANANSPLDEYMERLQTGEYKLEYCLIGTANTLSSCWYEFANKDGKNSIYIDPTLQSSVIKEQDEVDKSKNSYKVVFAKTDITTWNGSAYVKTPATTYYMRMLNRDAGVRYSFSITKGVTNYNLKLLGDKSGKTVSVYECDANGVVTEGGAYLSFYINYNNANSILGTYTDIEKLKYETEVYAQGSDYAASSKSQVFLVTMLDFGSSLSLNDGIFSWIPQDRRTTTIVFKRSGMDAETEVQVNTITEFASFSLDYGAGLYEYIKFVMSGEINGNNVYVDSDIYTIENVYKLTAPRLSNSLGYIAVDGSENISMLDNCYSEANLYTYMLYNDVSTEEMFISFADDSHGADLVYYQPGVQGATEEDLTYKETEQRANWFEVAALGTTAQLAMVADPTNYYMKKICMIEPTEDGGVAEGGGAPEIDPSKIINKSVAMKSSVERIDAQTLDEITELRIDKGSLAWEGVQGRTVDGTTSTLAEGASFIYRITVEQYEYTGTAEGEGMEAPSNVGVPLVYYTANTTFDFAVITEDQLVTTENPSFLKATVQALAMIETKTQPAEGVDYLELVEGGYAYGNVKYAGKNVYVLIGNGVGIQDIDRIAPIDENSLRVANGRLRWEYTTSAEITEEFLDVRYSFEVAREDGHIVEGVWSVVEVQTALETNTYTIEFQEEKGQILAGEQTLRVYATQGYGNADVTIKSFAQEIVINKLETIVEDDYVITTNDDVDRETLDLTQYYSDGNTNVVNVYVNGELKYNLTSQKYKIFILKTQEQVDAWTGGQTTDETYISDFIFVAEEQVIITFEVIKEEANTVYSDMSDNFVLQRASWGANQIVWDSTKQQFSWTQSFYFENNTTAKKVVAGEGGGYEETADEEEILAGQLVEMVETLDATYTIVRYTESLYKVETSLLKTPEYSIEITYGTFVKLTRIYTTTSHVFIPEIVDSLTINVRFKLGRGNVQSAELGYSEAVNFDLFASGQGTESNPYLISNEQQFANIQYRMSKPDYLGSYVENGLTVNPEVIAKKFYFRITQDITISEDLIGCLLSGEFNGEIDGQHHIITYAASGVTEMSYQKVVDVGHVKSAVSGGTSTTFKNGVALFEKIGSQGVIKNLKLDVTYRNVQINRNAMMAGLAVFNNGVVQDVDLVGYRSGFFAYAGGSKLIMSYAGIVASNETITAVIEDCSVLTNMIFDDNGNQQLIFAAGICFQNEAAIDGCVAGADNKTNQLRVTCQVKTDTIQVAGIAITVTTSGLVANCANYMNISVIAAPDENFNIAYIGGIACYADGTMDNATNVSDPSLLTSDKVPTVYKHEFAIPA